MVSDLDGDGVGDVIIGRGVEDTRGALTALDGKTGEVLWNVATRDEVYSTTCLVDLNGDGIVDPLYGGRPFNNGLIAVDGSSGKKLWSLKLRNPSADFPMTNFNTPLVIPDQDGDGVDELLVTQSGGQDATRPPARLRLISGRTGRLLWTKRLPDNGESYSVPGILREGGKIVGLFATSGGEQVAGHLFSLSFPV